MKKAGVPARGDYAYLSEVGEGDGELLYAVGDQVAEGGELLKLAPA